MKKPKHKILYGAGMLAMALSLTACERMERVESVYGPPRETEQEMPPEPVYGPPDEREPEEQTDPDDGATSEEKADAGNSQKTGE